MLGSNFNRLERWFHWLALEPAPVRHLAFDLECAFALPARRARSEASSGSDAGPADGAVYVVGLARSGTTVLLRALDQCDLFRSPTYRDMPFVLAPNLWRLFSGSSRRETVPAERAHGDGIVVDVDSPEAFEEVFWRTFSRRTADTRCFGAEPPSPEALLAFADYRAVVANPRMTSRGAATSRRYLSKNNNNLVRLDALCAEPTATVLLVYRHPVATARSLFRQHRRFCALQSDDRFIHDYMRWLAHHEFGLGHLPFCFALPAMDRSLIPDDPNYWLDYWNAVYLHVLEKRALRLRLVNHDTLRERPMEMLDAILSTVGARADLAALAARITPASPDDASTDEFRADLVARSETIHRTLCASSQNIAGAPMPAGGAV